MDLEGFFFIDIIQMQRKTERTEGKGMNSGDGMLSWGVNDFVVTQSLVTDFLVNQIPSFVGHFRVVDLIVDDVMCLRRCDVMDLNALRVNDFVMVGGRVYEV
jgi:hypothetical protein